MPNDLAYLSRYREILEAHRLVSGFCKLENPCLRKRAIDFVERLAEEQAAEKLALHLTEQQ